jgi:hypothetical protein
MFSPERSEEPLRSSTACFGNSVIKVSRRNPSAPVYQNAERKAGQESPKLLTRSYSPEATHPKLIPIVAVLSREPL